MWNDIKYKILHRQKGGGGGVSVRKKEEKKEELKWGIRKFSLLAYIHTFRKEDKTRHKSNTNNKWVCSTYILNNT